jgi:transglutaminase-like putative cysteine protease
VSTVEQRSYLSGWRLRVRHHTQLHYAGPVRTSYNEARLTPSTGGGQTTLEARVEVSPVAQLWRYVDYWGTNVTTFDLHEEHELLDVTATSVVETAPSTPVPAALSWGELKEHRGDFLEVSTPTRLTTVDAELLEAAFERRESHDPYAAAVNVADWVRENVAYEPGTTGVRTSAQEAWALRKGVCQDLAHLTVGMLRALGIPARYVSGYIHPSSDAEVGTVSEGQSHAWVEWWTGGWTAYDPTNGVPVGERHVVVARGRDYDDVPPLKGVYRGASSSWLGVTVEVERLA